LPLLAAIACAVASLVALSCGDDNDTEKGAASNTDLKAVVGGNLITDEDVASRQRGSPERALLSFFQAVQYRDSQTALSLIARAERADLSPKTIRGQVARIGSSLGRPRIVVVRRTGNKAMVRTVVLSFEPGNTKPSGGTPVTFALRKERNRWVLEDLTYLVLEAREVVQAERRHRPRPGQP
jgi:hypothetical protein